MELTLMEKRALFAFGNKNREDTVKRLGIVCSCTMNLELKKMLCKIHNWLGEMDASQDKWFAEFFKKLQIEIEDDFVDYDKTVEMFLKSMHMKKIPA